MKGLSQSPARCRGLNLFEVIALLLIVGGLAYGFVRGFERGFREALLGALIGGSVAWLAFVAMMLAILIPLWLFFVVYRPQFPLCAAGRCRDRHYRHLGEEEMPELRGRLRAAGKEAWLVRCGCGTLYCSSLTEQRFFRVSGEGELQPFMRYRPYRRWEPDPG
jgi:hypothetical protein